MHSIGNMREVLRPNFSLGQHCHESNGEDLGNGQQKKKQPIRTEVELRLLCARQGTYKQIPSRTRVKPTDRAALQIAFTMISSSGKNLSSSSRRASQNKFMSCHVRLEDRPGHRMSRAILNKRVSRSSRAIPLQVSACVPNLSGLQETLTRQVVRVLHGAHSDICPV